MPLGEGQRLPVWQVSQRDRPAARGHCLAEPPPVRVPGHPVKDHPREVELRIEGFEATAPRARREDPVQPKALVTADGQIIEQAEPPPAESQPVKKSVFGKPVRRYSNRL